MNACLGDNSGTLIVFIMLCMTNVCVSEASRLASSVEHIWFSYTNMKHADRDKTGGLLLHYSYSYWTTLNALHGHQLLTLYY